MRRFIASFLVFCVLCIVSLPLMAGEPLVVAHRGLLRHAPENTLANFRVCLELRMGFEFDVQRSKDGHLICIHDSTVDRTTNGKGKVSELTLAEIQKLDAGRWFDPKFTGETVPTVEEVLKLVKDYRDHNVLIAVDLKSEEVERDVVQLANEYRVLHRLLFIGRTISEPGVRKTLREASSSAQVATLANSPAELPQAVNDSESDWVYVRFLPTREQIESVRSAKKKVFIAGTTVSGNVPENWRRASQVGIDGLLTDYPLEFRTTLKQKSTVK